MTYAICTQKFPFQMWVGEQGYLKLIDFRQISYSLYDYLCVLWPVFVNNFTWEKVWPLVVLSTWLNVTVLTSNHHVLLVESRVCNWMGYTMFAWGWVCCCHTSGILSIFRRKLCAFENPSLKFSMNGRVGIFISVPTLGHWILLFN